jgi:hypothetical protein
VGGEGLLFPQHFYYGPLVLLAIMQKGFLGRFRLTQVFLRKPRYGHYVRSVCMSPYHVSECIRAGDPTPTPQTSPEGKSNGIITQRRSQHYIITPHVTKKECDIKIRETTRSQKQTYTGLAPIFVVLSEGEHNNLLFLSDLYLFPWVW